MQERSNIYALFTNFIYGNLYSSKYLIWITFATNGFDQIALMVITDHRFRQSVVLLESLPDHFFGIVATPAL